MNLVIDEGNTAFKIALFEGDSIVQKGTYSPEQRAEMHDLIVENLRSIKKAIVSSVVDNGLDLSRYSFPIIRLGASTPVPIHNLYKSRETLGKDRLANVVAAHAINKNGNSLVIDCGTCVKIDFVNSNGEYYGGTISPGLTMRFLSLHEHTAHLPLVKAGQLSSYFGENTEISIRAGVQMSIVYEIKGSIQRFRKENGSLTIFMTGGDAKYFDKAFEIDIFADSELTLKGLNEILKFNA